jgi:hypothetical protein
MAWISSESALYRESTPVTKELGLRLLTDMALKRGLNVAGSYANIHVICLSLGIA